MEQVAVMEGGTCQLQWREGQVCFNDSGGRGGHYNGL